MPFWDMFSKSRVEKLKAKGDVQGLIDLLTGGRDYTEREEVAWALGKFADPRAVEPLIAYCERWPDKWPRPEGVKALAAIADSRSTSYLFELAYGKSTEKSLDRPIAQKALENISKVRAIEPLTAALKDPRPEVRVTAAKILGNLADSRTVPAAPSGLEDGGHEVRKEAKTGSGMGSDPVVIEPLTAALKDEHFLVRETAVRALAQQGERSAVEPITGLLKDQHVEVRKAALEALLRVDPANEASYRRIELEQNAPDLVKLLLTRDYDSWENIDGFMAAAGRLGEIRYTPAIEPLLNIAIRESKYPDLREAAQDALIKIGDSRIVRLAVEWLESKEERSGIHHVGTILERMLISNAENISPDDLRAAAGLKDIKYFVSLPVRNQLDEIEFEHSPVEYNHSSIRELAKKELKRRGLDG